MKLEDQVVNLELSKKLKELGIRRESLFYWINFPINGYCIQYMSEMPHPSAIDKYGKTMDHAYGVLSAFTASELLELLPQDISVKKRLDDFIVYMPNRKFPDDWHSEIGTLPDCLAKMLIHLIKYKLIEI